MAEMVCDELTTAPIPHPPVVEKMWSEIEPGKKARLGGRCFNIWFYFAFSCSDLIDNKLVNFPELNVLTITVVGE